MHIALNHDITASQPSEDTYKRQRVVGFVLFCSVLWFEWGRLWKMLWWVGAEEYSATPQAGAGGWQRTAMLQKQQESFHSFGKAGLGGKNPALLLTFLTVFLLQYVRKWTQAGLNIPLWEGRGDLQILFSCKQRWNFGMCEH